MALNELQKQERSEYLERELEITECSQRKPYVFISYASDDWETVFKTAVVPMQKQYGLRVYADKAFDKVNDRWIVPMLRNVRGSDAMVVFVSQSYIESYACFLELLTAVNNKKPIVFVSLEQQLDLGDTTDQPNVEYGVKKEILNQGADIATNVNNTSNDLMRAMKSAYTSISTLLEQDALSKYDISDAFINFFKDAAINRKTINDLNAVRRTIRSISQNVFDKSLIAPVKTPAPDAGAAPLPQTGDAQPAAEPAFAGAAAAEEAAQPEPATGPVLQNAVQAAPQTYTPPQSAGAPAKKLPDKKLLIGATVAVVVLVLVLVLVFGGGTKNVTDRQYTTPDGFSGVYTGQWKGDGPSGQGVMTLDSGDVFEGEWADGVLNGQGTGTWANGNTYTGEFRNNNREGTGIFTFANGDVYEGEFKENKRDGQGVLTEADGTVWDGEWSGGSFVRGRKELPSGKYMEGSWDVGTGRFSSGIMYADNGNILEGTWDVTSGLFINGTITYENGDVYEGRCENDYRNGQGRMTYENGNVWEGIWKDGAWDEGVYDRVTDGAHFEGKWIEGHFSEGTFIAASGAVYEGEFDLDAGRLIKGKITSDGTTWEGTFDPETGRLTEGRRTMPDGDYRDGSWDPETETFISGTARATQSDGRVYEGEWSNGTANGRATMTHPDGTVVHGIWKDGQLVQEDEG